jgi:hypothetical protein
MKAVEMRGGTYAHVHRLSRPDGEELIVKIADLIVGARAEVFKVVVDYSQTLADMIAAGKYDWVNSDITQEHFPVKGEGKVESELVLVHLNRTASTEEVLKELDNRGLQPATIAELLAFGAKYPDKQKEFPIIALGSVWQPPHGHRLVAYLHEHASDRHLYLFWYERGWPGSSRFLASRK